MWFSAIRQPCKAIHRLSLRSSHQTQRGYAKFTWACNREKPFLGSLKISPAVTIR